MDIHREYWQFLKIRQSAPRDIRLIHAYDVPDRYIRSGTFRVLMQLLKKNHALLDIGAGDKRLRDLLKAAGWLGSYFSMDVNADFQYDYASIEQIDRQFDCITLFEVIEHLDLEEGIRYLESIFRLLKKGGVLLLSTPNAHHINKIWASDVTHIRPWPHSDIWAVLQMIGFSSVDLYRVRLHSRMPSIQLRVKYVFQDFLCRLLGVDCADGIMAVAIK